MPTRKGAATTKQQSRGVERAIESNHRSLGKRWYQKRATEQGGIGDKADDKGKGQIARFEHREIE
jgi:hypothetical protein